MQRNLQPAGGIEEAGVVRRQRGGHALLQEEVE